MFQVSNTATDQTQ